MPWSSTYASARPCCTAATHCASSWNSSTFACGANCLRASAAVELDSVATFLPLRSSTLVIVGVVRLHHDRVAGLVVRPGEGDLLRPRLGDRVRGEHRVDVAVLDQRLAGVDGGGHQLDGARVGLAGDVVGEHGGQAGVEAGDLAGGRVLEREQRPGVGAAADQLAALLDLVGPRARGDRGRVGDRRAGDDRVVAARCRPGRGPGAPARCPSRHTRRGRRPPRRRRRGRRHRPRPDLNPDHWPTPVAQACPASRRRSAARRRLAAWMQSRPSRRVAAASHRRVGARSPRPPPTVTGRACSRTASSRAPFSRFVTTTVVVPAGSCTVGPVTQVHDGRVPRFHVVAAAEPT